MKSILVVLVALSLGCSSPTSPTAPTSPRTGPWAGTLSDPSNGQGSLRVVLFETSPDGRQLGGTWTATFADPSKNASGDLSGTVDGGAVSLTLLRSVPIVCPNPGPVTSSYGSFFARNLTIVGTTMSGSYDYFACAGNAAGSLQVSRQ